MDSLFRVYLSGTFLADEPFGLNETELTITRDELLKGVFFSFTSELVFWGDGYAALKVIRDTQAGCSQVPCNIEYKCAETGGYEVLFEGIIPLGSEDVEWDDYNCKVTSKIENADFSNFLKLYGDYEFIVNRDRCIDNSTSLAQITTNETEFFGAFNGTLNGVGVKTYLFTDVLNQILEYLSNNTMSLNPDPLYSTLYVPQRLTLGFIDPIVNGDTIEITWTNYYGQDYSMTHTAITGIQATDISIAIGKCMHVADANKTPLTINRTNFFEKAGTSTDFATDITNYIPWSAFTLSVNGGAKAATIVESQAFQYGLQNLAVLDSALIQQQEGALYITLNKLLLHASQMNNMGFRIVKTGLTYQFNLTFLPDLLDNTNTDIVLPQIKAITSKSSKQYDAQSITTPEGITDNIFKPFTWDSNTCYSKPLKVEEDRFSTQDFFDIIGATQVQDNELYWVFLKDGDYTEVERFTVHLINDTSPIPSLAIQTHYNIPYIMPLIAKAYQINVSTNNLTGQIPLDPLDVWATCTNCPEARILNTNTLTLNNVYKFDYPLSFTQVQTLIDNNLQFITFKDGRNISKQGFIQEVTIPFKNFICSFTVYAD